jgi:hypothetical protein
LQGWGWFGGRLPAASLLQALSKLTAVDFTATGLTGELPPDWGGLAALEEVRLGGNALAGPLPQEWARLSRLRVLQLL